MGGRRSSNRAGEVLTERRCLPLFPALRWGVFIKEEITVVCLELKSEQITQKEESRKGGQEATHNEKQKQAQANWDQAVFCM